MAPLHTELTQGLSDDEAAALLALGTVVPLRRGEHLFRIGTVADAVYVVEQGRVSLTLPMRIRDGEEEVVVEEKNPGAARPRLESLVPVEVLLGDIERHIRLEQAAAEAFLAGPTLDGLHERPERPRAN